MDKPTISIIAAIGKNRELGRGNKLLWDLPTDMKHFRDKTRGHAVIMGRKTHESIGRVLPDRPNIIVTRDADKKIEGCLVVSSIDEALEKAKEVEQSGEIFVIGGAQIYDQALPFTDKLYLTLVDEEVSDADTFFPDYSMFHKVSESEEIEENGIKFKFLEFER